MYEYANESYLITSPQNFNYTAITKNNGFALVIIMCFMHTPVMGITVDPSVHNNISLDKQVEKVKD